MLCYYCYDTTAFVSKLLTPVQLKWSTIQTEAYAIFTCCTQLEHLIRDRPSTIHTDHKNLTYMTKNSSSMVARWGPNPARHRLPNF